MASASVAKPLESVAHLSIDEMQLDSAQPDGEPEDLYTQLKTLQRQLEFYEIQARACCSKSINAGLACCVLPRCSGSHAERDVALATGAPPPFPGSLTHPFMQPTQSAPACLRTGTNLPP